MAILELIGMSLTAVGDEADMFPGHLTIWVSPRIFAWDNEWFRYHETGTSTEYPYPMLTFEVKGQTIYNPSMAGLERLLCTLQGYVEHISKEDG